MKQLKFHDSRFVQYALTQDEPANTLKSLIAKHDEVCAKYEAFKQQQKLEENKWRKTNVKQDGIEESIIDYALWKTQDEESYTKYTASDFIVLELIDWIEEKIDIKICHLNNNGGGDNK